MRKIYFISAIMLLALTTLNAQKTFHDFTVKDINGEEFSLSQFKGKKVLVVNTASKCALTPQYEGLQKLYDTHGGDDFIIVGFPANNFAKQEPGTNEEIASFCETKYEIKFPLMSKVSVKGDDQHPLYKWLTSESENGLEDSKVTWNFQKYMIDEEGKLIGHFAPQTKPKSEKLLKWITSE
jgi:glutathione peroxidase